MDHRIIIKFGTSTLTAGSRGLSLPRLFDLVRQVVSLWDEGYEVAVVTSGAIAAGREALNYPELPRHLPEKQMLAAVGQSRLMGLYDQFFRMFDKTAAQVLLTRADLTDRRRYLNARGTMEALLSQKITPVINENDTVATEEIRFGDNDTLSAQVANLVEADLLVLCTDQPGLFTGDPRQDPNAQLIPEVTGPDIPAEIWLAAGGSVSGLGTGGMVTKISAADLARRSGTTVVIIRGSDPDALIHAAHGENIGTRILPVVNQLESRKRYLLAGIRALGVLNVDEGAASALTQGRSLLPVGVRKIEGDFERGDTVRVVGPSGKDIALGLVNYESRDMIQLCGHRSKEIESILGYTQGDEMIHANNLILL